MRRQGVWIAQTRIDFDRETNLHYNYFRDYDPNTGRYIQSEPIGLAGGINTYNYVAGDPLNNGVNNGVNNGGQTTIISDPANQWPAQIFLIQIDCEFA